MRGAPAAASVATTRPLCFEAGVFRAVLVGMGGLFGSLARYWLAGTVQACTESGLPFGTLTVNVVGSFIVAFCRSEKIAPGGIALTVAKFRCFANLATYRTRQAG